VNAPSQPDDVELMETAKASARALLSSPQMAPMFRLVLTVPRVLDAVLARASDIWKASGATVQESLIAAAHEAETVLTEQPWLLRVAAPERLN